MLNCKGKICPKDTEGFLFSWNSVAAGQYTFCTTHDACAKNRNKSTLVSGPCIKPYKYTGQGESKKMLKNDNCSIPVLYVSD